MRRNVGLAVLGVLLCGCEPDDFRYVRGEQEPCRSDECQPPPDAPSCDPWLRTLEDVRPQALAIEDASVWVAGGLEQGGRPSVAWVGRHEPCTGQTAAAGPLWTYESSVGGIVRTDGGVLVAGTTVTAAFLTELDPQTLSTTWSASFEKRTLVAAVKSGSAVFAGGTALDAEPRAFVVRRDAGGEPCSVAFGNAPSDVSALVASDDGVFAAGREGTAAALFRLDTSGCNPPPQAYTALMPPGASSARAGAVTAKSGIAYIGGVAELGSGAAGFVLALDVQTGAVLARVVLDRTDSGDGVEAIATDGTRLYVGGFSGRTETVAGERGMALLGALELPLADGAQPSWVLDLAAGERVTALDAPPGSSTLYVALSRAEGSSAVVRCTTDGGCP